MTTLNFLKIPQLPESQTSTTEMKSAFENFSEEVSFLTWRTLNDSQSKAP